jgi:hypothetical protein
MMINQKKNKKSPTLDCLSGGEEVVIDGVQKQR